MRKLLLCSALALSVGACSTAQVSTLSSDTANVVQAVHESAANLCKIIPEAGSIVSIFNAAIGATVSTVTNAICSQVPPPASAKYKALPAFHAVAPAPVAIVSGVTVTGWRVQ